jgi:hypothetical protein
MIWLKTWLDEARSLDIDVAKLWTPTAYPPSNISQLRLEIWSTR